MIAPWKASIVLAAGLVLRGSAAPAEVVVSSTKVVPDDRVSGSVALRDVEVNGGDVSGVLVNTTSGKDVRDVELLIRYDWLWKNEFRPGEDSPSRAVYFTVPARIPPGGHAAFTYRVDPPLPVRSDGRFQTSVEISGLVEVGD